MLTMPFTHSAIERSFRIQTGVARLLVAARLVFLGAKGVQGL